MKKTIEINWTYWFIGSILLICTMLFSVLTLIVTLEPAWCILTGLAVIAGLIWRDLEVNLDSN